MPGLPSIPTHLSSDVSYSSTVFCGAYFPCVESNNKNNNDNGNSNSSNNHNDNDNSNSSNNNNNTDNDNDNNDNDHINNNNNNNNNNSGVINRRSMSNASHMLLICWQEALVVVTCGRENKK